ncbi:putative Periplasmic protein TonB [Magnetospirillum sp. XM-1]|uniref:energy transducer TonB n=1 Tax=Magnetospirillum sp. XM-1 TaxID=1663591 RepID=UPI00073E0DE0|nr:energy transducer TonB [Magnetospirillum sp. XM-1]CUW39838.1 putative Periplasmic protein TonB [Magnetospirillum sp. XM-1]
MHAEMADRRLVAALFLSAALHVLIALLLQVEVLPDLFPKERSERSMEVEVVSEPPRPVKPQPPPEPPAQPEPPPKTETPPQPSPPPLQRPQLQSAPLAEKSSTPRPAQRPDPAPHAAQSGPGLSADTGALSRPAQAAGNLAQSAQDKVLAQVIAMWHFNSGALRGSDMVLSASLLINRDGTLSGPMHKDAPWNPDAAIKGYSKLPDGTTKRMLETFLLALRMAQPLQLPPDDGKGWPRQMILRFKPGDLSR